MPMKRREGKMWGVARVCEATGMGRAAVVFLMENGYIKSRRFRRNLWTLEKYVDLFLEREIQGLFGDILDSEGIPLMSATLPPEAKAQQPCIATNTQTDPDAATDAAMKSILTDIENLKKKGTSTKNQRFRNVTNPLTHQVKTTAVHKHQDLSSPTHSYSPST